MVNKPLDGNEHGKLVVFTILHFVAMFFLVSIIPTIFLIFGLKMMKRNKDFSQIEAAVRNTYWVLGLLFILCCAWLMNSLYSYYGYYGFHMSKGYYSAPIVLGSVTLVYFLALHYLFLDPLSDHHEWVTRYGIFSNKETSSSGSDSNMNLDIIQGEKFRQYSVADELTKWAKLKEDGHITSGEYNEARKKLLKQA